MWSTREELEAALRQSGLGEWAPRLAAAARHAIILEPGPVKGADAPIGASRLGGMPDLPAEVPWPWRPALSDRTVFKDHAARPWPLSFVAQIDFAEILSVGGLEGFPSSGRLLLFCDPVEYPWGMSMEDQTCASVMFLTQQTDRLSRRGFPVEFSNPQHRLLDTKDFVFRPRRLRPMLWLLPPPVCSRELLGIDDRALPHDRSGIYPKHWGQATKESYEQFWRDLAAKHPNAFGPAGDRMIHQVGGIPFSIQDPVETDCVKFADDDYNNQPQIKAWFERGRRDGPPIHWPDFEEQWRAFSSFEDRHRATHFDRANRWQLVLQIDSDFEAGMQWGDAGRIFVCMRKQDLAGIRFDRRWTILQCT